MLTESNTTRAIIIATITATGLATEGYSLEITGQYKSFDENTVFQNSRNSLFSSNYDRVDETTALFWDNKTQGLYLNNSRINFKISSNKTDVLELANSLFMNSIVLDEFMESALTKTLDKIGKEKPNFKGRL